MILIVLLLAAQAGDPPPPSDERGDPPAIEQPPPDDGGDEPDGRDEMLCPHDVTSEQYLMDDDLAKIFAKKKDGVALYFIADSCHSGSVTKFANDPVVAPNRMPRIRLLPPLEFVKDEAIRQRIPLAARAPFRDHRRAR